MPMGRSTLSSEYPICSSLLSLLIKTFDISPCDRSKHYTLREESIYTRYPFDIAESENFILLDEFLSSLDIAPFIDKRFYNFINEQFKLADFQPETSEKKEWVIIPLPLTDTRGFVFEEKNLTIIIISEWDIIFGHSFAPLWLGLRAEFREKDKEVTQASVEEINNLNLPKFPIEMKILNSWQIVLRFAENPQVMKQILPDADPVLNLIFAIWAYMFAWKDKDVLNGVSEPTLADSWNKWGWEKLGEQLIQLDEKNSSHTIGEDWFNAFIGYLSAVIGHEFSHSASGHFKSPDFTNWVDRYGLSHADQVYLSELDADFRSIVLFSGPKSESDRFNHAHLSGLGLYSVQMQIIELTNTKMQSKQDISEFEYWLGWAGLHRLNSQDISFRRDYPSFHERFSALLNSALCLLAIDGKSTDYACINEIILWIRILETIQESFNDFPVESKPTPYKLETTPLLLRRDYFQSLPSKQQQKIVDWFERDDDLLLDWLPSSALKGSLKPEYENLLSRLKN